MSEQLCIKETAPKQIYDLGDAFKGNNKKGDTLSFNNYYMEYNGKPFFGISGEFHFSRMAEDRWEDELIKMKLCGVTVVSTYVFWIHHEEEEGTFVFEGRRNLRLFLELCKKHGLWVILRVGPFDHGEVRNGGLPDWLYGKPFEVRTRQGGFLYYVRRLYEKIGEQTAGLYFQDNGPIIGVQIDNEYMHSSAPWEMTAGISDEWVFGGNEGNDYMLALQELAQASGLIPVFYTCTGWGGAATPETMMPLWGGYAYRPWIFYSHKGEHPATEEYIYQDFHNNGVVCTNDFKPSYLPETRPYACCEMGGGMMCGYYYRFKLPYKSVDAMANIKIASGCNFLGYYMFQGGSNPIGAHGMFLNEGQVPKISYDYQAALGEFGQLRESYRRLKSIHYFADAFGESLCGFRTVLPEGASAIDPQDLETLRYAVRTDGRRGFLFVNNFQDHRQMPYRREETVVLSGDGGDIEFCFGIAGDENAILPFHLDMDGINLVSATAQPVTVVEFNDCRTYIFFVPDGMEGAFQFEDGVKINGEKTARYACGSWKEDCCEGTGFVRQECSEEASIHACHFTVEKGGCMVRVLVLSRELANDMYRIGNDRVIFARGAVLADESGLRLETTEAVNHVLVYPSKALLSGDETAVFEEYCVCAEKKEIPLVVEQVSTGRYTIDIPESFLDGCKDVRLQIDYEGDIGHAFLADGRMIHDNFANGAVWEIGLRDFKEQLARQKLTIYITPRKRGAKVNVESAMAARIEEVSESVAVLKSVTAQPVYELRIDNCLGE